MTVEATPNEVSNFRRLLAEARREDLGAGDVTSALLDADARACGRFVAREPLVLCGGIFLAEIARAYAADIETRVGVPDGTAAAAGTELAVWRGTAREILAAERVALNFLQRLSGIATTTHDFVRAAAGVAVYDTRKTTPGWREIEKYAVRCGGGRNHRRGLYDAVLVKDNHLAVLAAAGVADPLGHLADALAGARGGLGPDGFVEVEVDTLEQLARALTLPVDVILLDNMTPEQMRRAVAMRDEQCGREGPALEASGGITLATAADVAATGVDRLAVGALTHSARAVDIALESDLAGPCPPPSAESAP